MFDASGLLVFPGFIDLHTHLREPGREYAETIPTGLAAAAAGGFTAVCAMPNTNPVNDSRAICEYIRVARRRGRGRAAVSDRRHHEGAEGRGARRVRRAAGGGRRRPLRRRQVAGRRRAAAPRLRAREPLRPADRPARRGPERSPRARRCTRAPSRRASAWPRQPAMAEAAAVARDLLVAELTGGRLHVAHLSTARALELVREAKADGLRVTCEVTPHHLVLTDEEVAASGFSTRTKMNPPLRERVGPRRAHRGDPRRHDRRRSRPTTRLTTPTRRRSISTPRPSESSASRPRPRSSTTGWSRGDDLPLERFAALFSAGPASAFGLPGGTLAPGLAGRRDALRSAAFAGRWIRRGFSPRGAARRLPDGSSRGAPAATIVGGTVVWQRVEL